MTDEERATLQALQSHIDEFKISFWQRIAYILGGAASMLVLIGVWVGSIQAGVWHGQKIDNDTADHGERLAVLEAQAHQDRAAIADKFDELMAELRRQSRRNQ